MPEKGKKKKRLHNFRKKEYFNDEQSYDTTPVDDEELQDALEENLSQDDTLEEDSEN